MPGKRFWASTKVQVHWLSGKGRRPARCISMLMKLRSKAALCATSRASPTNSTKRSITSGWWKRGASRREARLMPWTFSASGSMSRSGWT